MCLWYVSSFYHFMLMPIVIMSWNWMYNLFFCKKWKQNKNLCIFNTHFDVFFHSTVFIYSYDVIYPDLELLRYRLKQIWINGILKVIISKSSCWLIKFRLNLSKSCNEKRSGLEFLVIITCVATTLLATKKPHITNQNY